jgi:hypothetical protein
MKRPSKEELLKQLLPVTEIAQRLSEYPGGVEIVVFPPGGVEDAWELSQQAIPVTVVPLAVWRRIPVVTEKTKVVRASAGNILGLLRQCVGEAN